MIEPEPSLTALERELMAYVEKLTEASEQSATQFRELEKKSTAKIVQRQTSIESSLTFVIESQALLISGLIECANNLSNRTCILKEVSESQEAIQQALKALEKIKCPIMD